MRPALVDRLLAVTAALLIAAPMIAAGQAPYYVVTTDLSRFDESAMSQGNGMTPGMFEAGPCPNEHAALFGPGAEIVDIGDIAETERAYFEARGEPYVECEHANRATAVNASGVVTGRSRLNNASGGQHPWIWTEQDGVQFLLPDGLSGYAPSINDNNTVVFSRFYATEPPCPHGAEVQDFYRGYVWTPSGGAQNLNYLVSDFAGFACIWKAQLVNNKGQILAEALDYSQFNEPFPVVLLPDSDGDARADDLDNCVDTPNFLQSDGDFDGIGDACDNCTATDNPDQRDSDRDGYGNRCDADLNGSGSVNAADLALFRLAFGSSGSSSNWNANADFNGSNSVNAADLAFFRTMFGKPPGPSGIAP